MASSLGINARLCVILSTLVKYWVVVAIECLSELYIYQPVLAISKSNTTCNDIMHEC